MGVNRDRRSGHIEYFITIAPPSNLNSRNRNLVTNKCFCVLLSIYTKHTAMPSINLISSIRDSQHLPLTIIIAIAIPVTIFLYWHRNHRGNVIDATNSRATPAPNQATTDENDGDGQGYGSVRPPPPQGYLELCVLRSKLPDDDRFCSAQNGISCFGRRPPDDDDVEHERRVLYIPIADTLTSKELSNLIIAIVDNKHYDPNGEQLPTVGAFAGSIAGLFFEPDRDGGKAIFVPITTISQHPDLFCGPQDGHETPRDYFVLNPDVMEDEATGKYLKATL